MTTDKELYHLQTSIQKALNPMEAPLKGKHARAAIISTFQTGECSTLWEMMKRQPLMEHRFTAWKFCHLLHKVLREGHHTIMKTSYFNKNLISQIGKMWKHLNDGVGVCIDLYSNLLVTKIEFHIKNTSFPGNLLLDFNELEKFSQNDINYYFELGVEVFDYLDDIIFLENKIFENINMFRMTCVTPQGQCRLAPMIPLIQDSNQLYDLMVRLMFKLHSNLPNDVLQGHRERFKIIFGKLKEFYGLVRPLPYFQDLIKVPILPEMPPNFSSKVDFGSYVPPVVIVPDIEPVEELVNTTIEEKSIDVDEIESRMRSEYGTLLQEKEISIRNLQDQIINIQRIHTQLINEHKIDKENLEEKVNHLIGEKESFLNENNDLKAKLNSTIVTEEKMAEAESKSKSFEDKYSKIKNLYSQIREEHIALLRKNGENVKQLGTIKNDFDIVNTEKEVLKEKMEDLLSKNRHFEDLKPKIIEAEKQSEKLLSENDSLKLKINGFMKEIEELKTMNSILKKDFENKIDDLNSQLEISLSKYEQSSSQSILKNNENNILMETIQTQKDTIKKLENTIEEQKKCKEGIECKLENEILERNKLENIFAVETKKYIALEGTHKNAVESNVNLQNEFTALKSELQTKIESLNFELEKVTTSWKESSIQNDLMNEKNNSLRDKNKDLEISILKLENLLEEQNQSTHMLQLKHAEEVMEKEKVKELLMAETSKYKLQEKEIHNANQQVNTLTNANKNIIANHDKMLRSIFNKIIKLSVKIINHKEEEYISVLEEIQSIIMILPATLSQMTEKLSDDSILAFMESILYLSHLFSCLRNNYANVSNSYSNGDKIINEIEKSAEICAETLLFIEQIPKSSQIVKDNFNKLSNIIQTIIQMVKSDEKLQNVDSLDSELQTMDKAIAEACDKIADILAKSRSKHEGLTLEVNERILDSCTDLIKAIMELVRTSKALQSEIVSIGKGSFTAKEFYKRNNKWTDGLISAAKNVGVGANLLVEAANKCITNDSKFHFDIIVAAQEIAASTTQLVVASKVKAPRESKNLTQLSNASKGVTHATASVVATTRDCTQRLESHEDYDFTKLTVHQAKTLEMEIQIKVLELEQLLENQRMKLAAFRKKNYNNS